MADTARLPPPSQSWNNLRRRLERDEIVATNSLRRTPFVSRAEQRQARFTTASAVPPRYPVGDATVRLRQSRSSTLPKLQRISKYLGLALVFLMVGLVLTHGYKWVWASNRQTIPQFRLGTRLTIFNDDLRMANDVHQAGATKTDTVVDIRPLDSQALQSISALDRLSHELCRSWLPSWQQTLRHGRSRLFLGAHRRMSTLAQQSVNLLNLTLAVSTNTSFQLRQSTQTLGDKIKELDRALRYGQITPEFSHLDKYAVQNAAMRQEYKRLCAYNVTTQNVTIYAAGLQDRVNREKSKLERFQVEIDLILAQIIVQQLEEQSRDVVRLGFEGSTSTVVDIFRRLLDDEVVSEKLQRVFSV